MNSQHRLLGLMLERFVDAVGIMFDLDIDPIPIVLIVAETMNTLPEDEVEEFKCGLSPKAKAGFRIMNNCIDTLHKCTVRQEILKKAMAN